MSGLPDNRALDLAQRFHDLYEELAPQFGYETRTETRVFDAETANGRLMIAVCRVILREIVDVPAANERHCLTHVTDYCDKTCAALCRCGHSNGRHDTVGTCYDCRQLYDDEGCA